MPSRSSRSNDPSRKPADSDGVKTKSKKLLANHQRSWIWGKHLVQETLAAGRWPIVELILGEQFSERDLSGVLKNAKGVQPTFANTRRLTQLCGSEEHQGWIARVGPYPYVPVEELLEGQPKDPIWLLLEGIQDPYNVGTILRSAEVFGVTGVCLGGRGQTGINSLSARSSVGAVNRLRISRADRLLEVIEELKRRKVTVVGTSLEATQSFEAVDCRRGMAIVIGNEGRGVSAEVLGVCSLQAKIPQPGTLNSLNVAAAAAIVCYEVQRQRGTLTSK